MNKFHMEVDCTKRCKSRKHGQIITSAITKRSVSDISLASFIKCTCSNFTQAFDYEGRTALHMSASRGRRLLLEWLIRHSTDAFVNARDRESGYTPLHRSIFYGQLHIAVALMKSGVNIHILDKDDYKALDHAMLDRHYMYKHDATQPCDVYVWGSNSNYTLGTGNQQQKKIPDILTCFSRSNASVKQVCLGKFHSVWLCDDGAWVCGQLSRAGAPTATAIQPAFLKLPEPCTSIALTLDSTVLLLQSGSVVQYSLNTDNSVSPSTVKTTSCIRLPSIKSLMKLSAPLGICASRVHVVFWNARGAYTWGTNLGQLGHSEPSEKYVNAPKRVAIQMNNKEDVALQLAAASDAATVVTTSRGDVYLLHKHMCKKIAIKQTNLRQVCVDAKVNDHGVYSRVTVLLLTNVGQLLIWQDTNNKLTRQKEMNNIRKFILIWSLLTSNQRPCRRVQLLDSDLESADRLCRVHVNGFTDFVRCVFGLNHQTYITNVTLIHDAMFFTTKYGEAFAGSIPRKASSPQLVPMKKEKDNNKSALIKFLEKDDCTSIKIVKIPNIHRAVSIAADSEGINFACLQVKPTCGLTSLPELSPSSLPKHMDSLLETATEEDMLHDVVFKVGTKLYSAHIFVIASGSEHLYKLYQEKKLANNDEKPFIIIENVLPEVFDRVIRYLYTGTCDVMELGPCSLKIRKDDVNSSNKKKKEKEIEEEIENSMELSAFEVYSRSEKENNNKRNGRNKQRQQDAPPVAYPYCDPVRLVQVAAKRLHVTALAKLLEKYYYREGSVYLKDNVTTAKNFLSWNRNSFPELVDTNVSSKEKILIPAHKCILAARLEYFQGMFMHSWTESKMKSMVSIPLSHGILMPIINFLYTDSCSEVENSESIDFICSMLIVADQLFITRLREMCEVALANLISLKNCTELCQFAHTYNAVQLKQCCMEFISLNLCSILENRSLDSLEDNLLEDLSKYYCKFNPIMASRIITPFYNAPDDSAIDECAKQCPVDLNAIYEECKKEETTEQLKKKSKSKKVEYTESEKARMRYESVSSVNSLDLSNDGTGDITLSLNNISSSEKDVPEKQKWIEVPTAQQKQQKLVQARLKAINIAKDLMSESPTESFTKLVKTNSSSSVPLCTSPQDKSSPIATRMSVSPKESPFTDMARSPQTSFIVSHVGPKLSQKQRKKLALQGNEGGNPRSLNDYFSNKQQTQEIPQIKSDVPKNPWKVCDIPTTSSAPTVMKAIQFNEILADQKKQKEDFSRIMTKPLALTQLEDKAIEELERFYNVHEVDDEWITVRRIELKVSSPQWIHTVPK